MDTLFHFIENKLNEGTKLIKLTNEIHAYCNEEIIAYCKSMSIYSNNKNTYNRVKLTQFSNDIFEMILICWNENSETKIHDHPENGCLLYVIDGSMVEYSYDNNLQLLDTNELKQKNVSYMDNSFGLHKIKCNQKTLSLHIYSPPNHKITYY